MRTVAHLRNLLCASASLGLTSAAAAQAPELSGVFPGGGPRGGTTTVQIDGKNLAGATLRFSGRGISVKGLTVAPGGMQATAEIAVEKDAWLGPREMRLICPKGISNGGKFWVDTLPNSVVASPSEADAPVSIDRDGRAVFNGRFSRNAERHRFAFEAKPGEQWVFQCRAFRIHSRFDPVFELRDENGRMVALAQNTWEADPTFVFNAIKGGKYVLTLRDSEYKGGPNFTYRLTAGVVPVAAGRLPLGGAPGGQIKLAITGPNMGSGAVTTLTTVIPADVDTREFWADVEAGGKRVSVPLLVERGSVTCAPESGDATLPELPAIVDGVFSKGPVARVKFHAASKERLLFDLLGRRIGSRIDGSLRVLDSSGKEIASNDDTVGKDSRMEFAPPAPGDYVLEIANLEEKTGPDCYWRLRAYRVTPDFTIELRSDRLHVPAGGTVALPVEVIRSGGYTGPVELRATGLPSGVSSSPVVVPPDKAKGELTFTAIPDAPLAFSDLRIIGGAKIDGKDVIRDARGWEQYEHRSIDQVLAKEYSYTRPHHDWDMLLAAVTENKPAFTVNVEPDEVALNPGGKCEFTIKVDRKGANPGVVKISYHNLPRGVTASASDIPDGKNEIKVTLTAAPDAPADIPYVIVTGSIGNASATSRPLRVGVIK
jgi:hypothetical protein